MKAISLLLLFAVPALSNGLFIFSAGTLQCGIVRRSINTVQTFCKSNNVLVHNTISTVDDKGLIIIYQYTGNSFVTLIRPDFNFDLVVNASNTIVTGTLDTIYDAK